MKHTFTLLLLALILCNCESKKSKQQQLEAAQIQLEIASEKELIKPKIEATGSYRKRQTQAGYQLSLMLTNTSKYTTYKDCTIEVQYYSKTNTIIHKTLIKISDTIKPNQTITVDKFTDETADIKDVNSLGWTCIDAVIVD